MRTGSSEGTSDPSRTAQVLWDARHQPSRGPKPKLALARIVEAAIAIADREGLAVLSMQRIAARLGAAKMALYRYMPGKAELMALMLDTAVGAPPDLSEEREGWRPRLRAWAQALWIAFHRHPWALGLATGARVMGPNELGWLEAGLGTLAETGLTGGERLDAIVVVSGHIRNLVQQSAVPSGGPTGRLEQRLRTVMGRILTDHRDRFPEVNMAFAAAAAEGEEGKALDFGLDRILDGLEILIRQRRRAGKSRRR